MSKEIKLITLQNGFKNTNVLFFYLYRVLVVSQELLDFQA